MTDPTDNLTPLARRILKQNAGHAYEKLVIGPTDGNPQALADLTTADPRALFPKWVTDLDAANAAFAALWLWQDYLHESHEICQSIETASGSWWHAILHRREGDFSNAKYWYARVNDHSPHPAQAILTVNAADLLRDYPADKSLLRIFTPHFSGPALVDLVQATIRSPADPRYKAAVALQQLEFRILFELDAAAAQK